jgi:REP element-mobilizing transposase RayT
MTAPPAAQTTATLTRRSSRVAARHRAERGNRSRRHVQQELAFPNTWGGKRPGAGRKPAPGRSSTPHRARPEHKAGHPVHVTLRSQFRPLRSQHVFPTVCLAIRGATLQNPARFRVLHFSVQWDHVHLIVEASDKRALSAGIRSLVIRVARYVNDLVRRRGRLWADRWHGRELTSPRQVRNALVYVLANFRKHAKTRPEPGIDAFSSAARFDGWRGYGARGALPRAGPRFHRAFEPSIVVSKSRTWLASVGWRRAGLVGVAEAPHASERERAPSP